MAAGALVGLVALPDVGFISPRCCITRGLVLINEVAKHLGMCR